MLFDPEEIFRELLDQTRSHPIYHSPRGHDEVNNGWCFIVALILWKRFPDARLWGNMSHAFVEVGGRFYDFDHPDGVTDWQSLKTFSDDPEAAGPDAELSAGDKEYAQFIVRRRDPTDFVRLYGGNSEWVEGRTTQALWLW